MDEELTERARRLVDGAETGTVTESLLVGGDEYTGEVFLYGDAPIRRLADGEQPHAMLFNDMKGVGVGSKRDTVTPEGSARSVFVVTDDRVLLLVGQQDGDWTRSVPLSDVTGAAYHTGFMKHRVVVDTRDARYHLWVDASYDERDLEATVALLDVGGEQGAGDDPRTSTTDSPRGADNDAAPSTASGTREDSAVNGREGGAGSGREGSAGAGREASARDGVDGASGSERTESDGRDPERDSAGAGSGGGSDGGGANDPLDTLERLKELHEKDVLTDEEFEAKKADLLDQI